VVEGNKGIIARRIGFVDFFLSEDLRILGRWIGFIGFQKSSRIAWQRLTTTTNK